VVKPEEVTKEFQSDIAKVAAYIKKNNISASSTPFARYLQYEPPKPVEMETGFEVAGVTEGSGDIKLGELPSGRSAVTIHKGPYEAIGAAYDALHAWMKKNSEQPGGAPWEVYLNSPAKVKPEALETAIYYPLK
jgi:effector-binding domain-containing protein